MKVFAFEVIRAVAIVLIISCHYLSFSGLNPSLGGMWGGVGNCIFFTLSALLFGLKWEKNGKLPFDKKWIKKRIAKIVLSLYPFLIILIGAFVLFDVHFRIIDAVFNFLFLGWIAKLPGNGHLWFLTVLAICYIIFFFISRFGFKRWNKRWVWLTLLAIVVACVIVAEHLYLPGHAFPMLLITTFAFINAKDILESVKKKSERLLVIQFIIISAFIVSLFQLIEIYQIYRPLAYLLYNIEGISLMVFLLSLNYKHQYAIISRLSGISFELYLVHHGFCQGKFSVLNPNSYLVSLVTLLVVSLISAYILKFLAESTRKSLNI